MTSAGNCASTINIIVLYVLCMGSLAQGAPMIVAPFPNNVYAIENKKTAVTCVVEDTVTNPDKITFVKKSRFGDTSPIPDEGPRGRIYYQKETSDNGTKLQVTLHFNKVLLRDDSRNGGYECRGYTGAAHRAYGFTVTVIELTEIPVVRATNNLTTEFGKQIELACKVTVRNGFSTSISQFIWKKDGRVLLESYYPSFDSLRPLPINVTTPDVGGVYTCFLEYQLRRVIRRSITKTIIVKVRPKNFIVMKSKTTIKLVCSAQGNPLVTEWKRKTQDDKIVVFDTAKDNSTEGKRYVFSNMNGFKDHTLTINDIQDTGQYYCCIKYDNSTRAPGDVNNCQAFDLRTIDISSADKAGLKTSLILVALLSIGLLPL